jgi:hypothetical protein
MRSKVPQHEERRRKKRRRLLQMWGARSETLPRDLLLHHPIMWVMESPRQLRPEPRLPVSGATYAGTQPLPCFLTLPSLASSGRTRYR